MEKAALRKGSGNLASLVPDSWYTNRDNSSFWLRIYTALLIPHDKFEEIVLDFLPDPDKHEFLWHIGEENDAMRKNDAFLEYWTALEVICNGKANRIKTRLQKIYGLQSQQEAGAATGLNTLAEWRHEYFHRGIRPSLSADVERYIQLMFLDLLRFEIDLTPREHLAAIQAAEGYDLSPIGLADKRTKEQREAAETHSARPRM